MPHLGHSRGSWIALFDNGVFAIGPVGSLIWERRQSDSSALSGLGNVGFTYEIGGFIDYWAVQWPATAPAGSNRSSHGGNVCFGVQF